MPTQPGGKNPDPTNPNVPINPDPTDTVPPAVVSGAAFGDLLNVITWVNPADADFSKVLILRNTSSIVDAPSAGKEYTVGGALIGTSRVVHNANSLDFSDSAATAGTLYYYKIFAYDASRNYAAGVEISATKNANKTIFVNATASGANDGTSWSNAFSDLQSALTEAAGVAETEREALPVQIVVAAGVYKPATSDRTMSFRLVSKVKVYGGFVGTEHSLSQRNWRMNKSILSGDLVGDDTDSNIDGVIEDADDIKGTETMDANGDAVVTNNNSRYVVIGADDATLDGFTITAGQREGNAIAGGGMSNHGARLKLSNIIFSGNEANGGGGLNNNADDVSLSNVIFSGNKSNTHGGGMRISGSDHVILSNVIFSGNTGIGGGGARINSSSDIILSNVIFFGNTANGSGGGGLYINFSSKSNVTLSNVVFSGNKAINSSGGGSYMENGDITLINVIMWGNTGTACTGISGSSPQGNANFCTIETVADSRTVNISHSLIQGCGGSGASAWATSTNSCGTDGAGNIDGDRTANNYLTSNYPMFVNAADANGADNIFGTVDDGLRLMTGSPAINTGSNNNPRYVSSSSTPPTNMEFLFKTGALDIAGNPRIVGSSIDMGAYESQ